MKLKKNKSMSKALALSMCFALAVPFAGPAVGVNAATATPETVPDYVENSDQYKLVWNDEFEGETLNTNDWNVELHEPGWVNAELQRYTKLDEGNIKVENGTLKLIPKAEKKADAEEESTSNGNVLKGDGFDTNWTGGVSADVGGKGSVEIKDGIAEVKIEDSGSQNYGIQVQEKGLILIPGHSYHLEFNAVSTAPRATEISFLNNPDPATWDWYAGTKKVIGTEEGKVEFDFEVAADKAEANDVILQLNFGNIDGFTDENGAADVTLSDVALVDLTAQAEVKYKSVLKGDGFDTNWTGGVSADVGGKGSVEIKDGIAEVKIENSGSQNYGIQVQEKGLTLTPGHSYHLEFDAVSTAPRATEISFLNNPDPATWDWYAGTKKVIGTEEGKVEFDFEVAADKAEANDVILQLNFGNIDGYTDENGAADVTLSNISLVDLSEIDGTVDVKKAYNYTSGRVNTQNKHDFTYGYFECAARVPEGQGYLPAFWLMASDEGNYGQWPKCGEVDIMEVMGQDITQSYHTIHYGYNATNGHRENQFKKVLEDGDFSTEYHVYGLDWEPGKLTWYVDGEEVGSTNDWYTGSDDDNQISYPAPFDQDFYVILNLAVGGSWVGYPDQAVVDDMENQSYDIDYVRVYQKDASVYEAMEAEVEAPVHEVNYREPDINGNYVVNGDFSEELKEMDAEGENFELHLESDCKEGTVYEINNNEIKIAQDNVGGQNHSVQLKQTGIPMYRGYEYELTFDAYADEARSIIIDVEGPDHGWQRYFNDTKVDLTTEKTTYTYKFTMNEKTDANGSLEFNLGNQDSISPVYISNISLKKSGGELIPEVFEKSVAPDGNYVYNGTFDKGEGRLGYWEVAEDDKDNVSVTNTLESGKRTRELRVKVEVPEGASEEKPIIISQSELSPIGKGDYEFSFDAYYEDGEQDGMEVVFSGKNYNPKLTSKKKNFFYNVTVDNNISRENANVSFKFTKGGTYYLDNVVFQESAMIKNGSFNSGLAGYVTGLYEEGDATFGVDSQKAGNDTAFDADIKDTGKYDWSIQVKQPSITLEKGKTYKLSFQAKATVDRTISVVMQRDGSKDENWDVYSGANDIDLTSKWKNFELEFDMTKDTDTNALLSISLGTIGDRISEVHHVYLDNFVLVETGSAEEKEATPTPTVEPSAAPTIEPTAEPTAAPSEEPEVTPTVTPTAAPTVAPTAAPTATPTPFDDTPKAKNNGDGKVQKGETTVTALGTFTATSKNAAKFTAVSMKAKDKAKVVIPATVKIDGKKVKVTSVGKDVLSYCDATEVVIGKNVKTIEANAFYGCFTLKKVTIKSKVIKKIGKNAFGEIEDKPVFKLGNLYKNKKLVNKYKKLIKKAGTPKKFKVTK